MKTRAAELLPGALLLAFAAALTLVNDSEGPQSPVLDAGRKTNREPLKPEDPLPPAPVADAKECDIVRRAVSTILEARVVRRGGCGNIYFGGSRFLFERDFFYREYRLLAAAYPEAAEVVAGELLDLRQTSSECFHAAIRLLEALARRGGRRAELILLQGAASTAWNPSHASAAMGALSDLDPARGYTTLYRKHWSAERWWARDLLDLSVDPESVRLLKECSSNPARASHWREDADKALARIALLQAPDGSSRLIDILKKRPSAGDDREEDGERRWALKVARGRGLDLRRVLRKRLDWDLLDAQTAYENIGRNPQNPSFEEHFRTWPHLHPRDWDDALVAFVELGGEPNPLERARLREFGFLCDPKARLEERLRELSKELKR